MKRLGIALISLSFVAGAYLASLDPTEVDWIPFFAVLAGGIAGVYILRRATQVEAGSSHRIAANTAAMRDGLAHAIREVEGLVGELQSMDVYDLPAAIDARVVPHLNVFAANRDTLKHAFGLQAFADIMTPYAGGERYLNRVWSASADGYVDEAALYLPRALEQLQEAQTQLAGAEPPVETSVRTFGVS